MTVAKTKQKTIIFVVSIRHFLVQQFTYLHVIILSLSVSRDRVVESKESGRLYIIYVAQDNIYFESQHAVFKIIKSIHI